jgi:hypothetical protein
LQHSAPVLLNFPEAPDLGSVIGLFFRGEPWLSLSLPTNLPVLVPPAIADFLIQGVTGKVQAALVEKRSEAGAPF